MIARGLGAVLFCLAAASPAGPVVSAVAQGLPAYAPINPLTASRSGVYFQPYVAPGTEGRGPWSAAFTLDYASTIESQRSPRASELLDTELLRAGVRVARDLDRSTFLVADAAVNGAYAGFMDGFLDWYHGLLGIDIPERAARPHGDFAYRVLAGDVELVRAPSDAFLGDLRLGIGRRLGGHGQSVLSLTLPTSTGPAGYGRGTVSVSLLNTARIPLGARAVAEGSLNVGVTPRHGELAAYQRTLFVSASTGARLRVGGAHSLYANLYYGSPIYDGIGVSALDGRELSLDFGWVLATGDGGEWRIGMTEDLEPTGPAIDLVFRVGRTLR